MKDAYYFSHDTNARRDPKILAVRSKYGSEGYAWYFMIIEILAEQKDYKYKLTKWATNSIAMELLCDANRVAEFINDCIKEFELFESDGEYFWSPSLIRRMQVKEEKRLKRAEAGRKGAEKRWGNSNAIAMPKQSDSNAIAKNSKVKESKVKNIFIPPTLEEVRAYCQERNNDVDPQKFYDYYTANGWVQGKARKPIKDWKACVRTWERNEKQRDKPLKTTGNIFLEDDV